MVKQRNLYAILLVTFSNCLNLSQAQTLGSPSSIKAILESAQQQIKNNTAAPQNQPAPAPVPIPPPVNIQGTANSAPANQQNSQNAGQTPFGGDINSDAIFNTNSTTGKFAEFMSICRSREFDKVQYQNKDQYNEKLKELQTQADSFKNTANASLGKDGYKLLEELVDLGDTKTFNNLAFALKPKITRAQDVAYLNALIAFAKNNYRDARTNFIKALVDDEKNEDILKVLAEVYKRENNFFEASAIYEDLNKYKQNSYLPELCETLVLNSLNADGEKICLLASKKFPDNPFPLIYAGITFRERDSIKRARDLFKRSLAVRQTEMGNICLAELSLLENKPAEAVEFFKVSVQQSPYSARAVLGLAWSQIKAHAYDGALDTFKKACDTNRKYEVEVRKAYKILVEEKIPTAEKFMALALRCGTS